MMPRIRNAVIAISTFILMCLLDPCVTVAQPALSIVETQAYLIKLVENNHNGLGQSAGKSIWPNIKQISFDSSKPNLKLVNLKFDDDFGWYDCSFDIRKVLFSEIERPDYSDLNELRIVSKPGDSHINVDNALTMKFTLAAEDANTLKKMRNAFIHLQNLVLEKSPLSEADVDPFLNYDIKPKEGPKLTIANTTLEDDNGNQIVEDNEAATLRITLRNMGQQSLESIKVELIAKHNNRGLSNESSQSVNVLMPQVKSDLKFRVTANDQVQTGTADFELIVKIGDKEYARKSIEISTFNRGIENVKFASLPDVDLNIPATTRRQPNKFALIVGNENYTDAPAVPFAKRDAKIFADYLIKTLGIPAENIFLETDLTKAAFDARVQRLALIPQVNPKAEIIFYFAGHGLPSFDTREQYLLPTDVNESNLKNGIKFNDLIASLNANRPERLIIFADACFTGGARTENLLSGRSVRVKPKDNHLSPNTLILSASSEDQVAKAFFDKKHGLFTYYLLLKLQTSAGNVSVEELFDFVKANVSEKSILVNGALQIPSMRHGQGVEFTDFKL